MLSRLEGLGKSERVETQKSFLTVGGSAETANVRLQRDIVKGLDSPGPGCVNWRALVKL
jgi:hypothetical protein